MRDSCRTSDTFSSTWQACQFLDVAKTLAGVSQNERWFWRSFFMAGKVLVNLDHVFTGLTVLFCKPVAICDFGHDDDSVWQVQHYDLTRPSYKNLRASQKNFHTTTRNADHLQDLNARTSEGGFEQNLHKILSQGPVQVMHRHPEDFTRTSSRSSHSLTGACTRSCKDLPGFRPDLDKIFS